ncbi:MAG: SMC-Scp complex subunit ScpB [Spirochaetaceae bacterium]|jgi:segregation and condensation protein B|nr:SMC-Scp complex subunit ScpB [Spirochaetaceae bacterium]
MELNLTSETALVEALLYLECDPVDEETIARITGLAKPAVELCLENLRQRFSGADSGIELVKLGGGIILAPKKEYWDTLRERYGKKNEAKLSRAAMETLAIVAYKQPVTRGEIEHLRGVSADNMIRLLVDRGLIKEAGKKDIPGHPVQYGTTKEFLQIFRLASIADLPKLEAGEEARFELAMENE